MVYEAPFLMVSVYHPKGSPATNDFPGFFAENFRSPSIMENRWREFFRSLGVELFFSPEKWPEINGFAWGGKIHTYKGL